MPFKAGAIYRTPNGRRYKAEREIRRHDGEEGWVFSPADPHDSVSWREELGQQMFLEKGTLVYFDFSGLKVRVCDTGWSLADLVLEEAAMSR